MKHLTILVPEGQNNISSIAGAYKLFTRANAHWRERGLNPIYDIQLAGVSKEVSFYDDLFSVKPHVNISDISNTDLIIIPSLNHNYHNSVESNTEIIDWIVHHYKLGAEVASICTGAFLLAKAGLLDGRRCSTHWAAANTFRQMFPSVQLQPDLLITDEHGIYTNGGAYSFLNLMLYLIEKKFDRETAIFCSKMFQIDIDRHQQSGFIVFAGQKKHGDDMVLEAQSFIEQNIPDKISVEHLSDRLAVGRRTFDRRFSKATGNTPIEYIQRVKIESAKKALEQTRKTVNEVMFDVGYTDTKAFRDVFKKVTGMSPIEYKRKYSLKSTNVSP
jgi:transcriptional regulator GlxA family with amidase domain